MQVRQPFLSSTAIHNASDDIQVFNENIEKFVSYYVHSFVSSEISRPSAISSFSEHMLCAKTSSPVVTVWIRVRILIVHKFSLNFYIFEWHGQAIFLHPLKDRCATAIGVLSHH